MCRAGREDPPDRAAHKAPEARADRVVPVVPVAAALVDRVAQAVRADQAVRVDRRPRSRPPNGRRRSLPRPAAAC